MGVAEIIDFITAIRVRAAVGVGTCIIIKFGRWHYVALPYNTRNKRSRRNKRAAHLTLNVIYAIYVYYICMYIYIVGF